VNRADFIELLKIPGIGKISARRIVETRNQEKFTRLDQLKKTGAVIGRARNFLTLDGKFYPASQRKATSKVNEQLFLWEEL
jgi:predicted DNA-binding helix-hairpin-helix protein